MKNKIIIVLLFLCLPLFAFEFGKWLGTPVVVRSEVTTLSRTELIIRKVFQIEYSLVKAISVASSHTNIDPLLIAALAYTESEFNYKAISKGGYYGLMQIPYRIFDPNLNFLIGASILREKFTLAKGDLRKTIALYKGYSLQSLKGRKQVDKVLTIYDFLKGSV